MGDRGGGLGGNLATKQSADLLWSSLARSRLPPGDGRPPCWGLVQCVWACGEDWRTGGQSRPVPAPFCQEVTQDSGLALA